MDAQHVAVLAEVGHSREAGGEVAATAQRTGVNRSCERLGRIDFAGPLEDLLEQRIGVACRDILRFVVETPRDDAAVILEVAEHILLIFLHPIPL